MAGSRITKSLWHSIRKILLILWVSNLIYIVLIRFVFPPITLVMINSLLQGYGLKRDYVLAEKISRNMKLAVIASEDQLFPEHQGFDWASIRKAYQYNQKTHQKKVRGASTISQQTAKNVFLWNGRSWFRKGLEVYHTFLIEWIWGKQRILEIYLNVAETGEGVFGVEAAAQHYFNKEASKLSRSEAAWIAAILPSPKKYNIQKPGRFLSRRHQWILAQMNNLEGDPEIMKLMQ